MARSLNIRKPRTSELRKLDTLLAEDLHLQQRRRAQAILLYGEGLSSVEFAAARRVRLWVCLVRAMRRR